MPIFDYRCTACDHTDEVFQKVGSSSQQICPACQALTFMKCVSAPHFRLGSTGWYETDEKPKSAQRNVVTSDTESPSVAATPSE